MVTMIRSDLDFILAQIKIAEADARHDADPVNNPSIVGTLIPNTELPWGLRRVDGSNNNLLPGQDGFGAADQPFPRGTTSSYATGTGGQAFGPPIDDTPGPGGNPIDFGFLTDPTQPAGPANPPLPLGYIPTYATSQGLGVTAVPGGVNTPNGTFIPAALFAPNYLTNHQYGVPTPDLTPNFSRDIEPGDVVDADPRIISNLIVDQTLNNPAAVFKALQVAGVEDDPTTAGHETMLAMQSIVDAAGAVRDARADLAAAIANTTGPNAPTVAAYEAFAATSDGLVSLATIVDTATSDLVTSPSATTLADAQTALGNLLGAANTILSGMTAVGVNAPADDLAAVQSLINTVSLAQFQLSGINAADGLDGIEALLAGFAETIGNGLVASATTLDGQLDATLASLDTAVGTAQAALTAAETALTNLISPHHPLTNPTGVSAGGLATEASPLNDILKATLVIENTAPDEGLSAPFNGWMTLFGQFFDHGLDLVGKGGFGTVYIPLQPDDPLYVPGSATNFMAVTRATLGPDGQPVNKVTPFVDQNQTYTSHSSHQFFLREYELRDDGAGNMRPHATGLLLNGNDASGGGIPTWADVKAQALNILGIELNDHNIGNVPEIMMDAYGNFIPGANGFPQLVRSIDSNGVVTAVEGSIGGTPARTADGQVSTGHAFLDDIAHTANPGATEVADGDSALGLADAGNAPVSNTGFFDNELLDRHYITGDGRGNENIGLTAVHHVFHSEHNRQIDLVKNLVLGEAQAAAAALALDPLNVSLQAAAAEKLAFLNEWTDVDLTAANVGAATNGTVVWDGERLFQAAKFPTEMQYQHLVFEEFARKVQPAVNIFNDYDATLDPAILAEFAHTVYRFGHSMLTETVDRFDPNWEVTNGGANQEQIGLISAFLNPLEFAASGADAEAAAGAIVRGMTRQTGMEIDEFVTEALRNNLVGLPLDLAAINIARGRETGVPSLNEARAQFYAGSGDAQVKPYESWADFALNIKNPASVVNFIAAYGTHSTITSATTVEDKRDAAMLLVLGGAGEPADRVEFLNATGDWTRDNDASLGGLNNIDFWIGGLAEKKLIFGGMLGSTFNFVFETQLEALQNGDRFYYLSRLANLNLTAQLENNKFSELIHRNTDATHLPGDAFARPDYFLEVDQTKQFNGDLLGADPTFADIGGGDPFLGALNTLVIRDVATNKLQYNGAEHVVLGGTDGNDILIGGLGDDTLWGDAGDDRLEGGDGNDFHFGGDGDDIITDLFGVNEIRANGGNDVVSVGPGINLIITDTGDDIIFGGRDDDEMLAGQGNDFVFGGDGVEFVVAGEGSDWIESGNENSLLLGDNGDLIQGLPIKIGVANAVGGDDILIAGSGGNADFDAEAGDDIMVAGFGTDRFFGAQGFDWVTHMNATMGVEADMSVLLFQPPVGPASPSAILDRYATVEGLTGSQHGDILRGDSRTLNGEVIDIVNPEADVGNPESHILRNIDLIDGLREFLPIAIGGAPPTELFDGGNIILGGGGSDVIEGRGGDDLIGGDHYLNVRIEVTPDATRGQTFGTFSVSSISEIQSRIVSGEIKVGQLRMVREILDGNTAGEVDTAEFSGLRSQYLVEGIDAPNATVGAGTGPASDVDGDGFISVRHLPTNQGDLVNNLGLDGHDRLKNIERVRFADQEFDIVQTNNFVPTGNVGITGLARVGETISINLAGVVDLDNVASGGAIVQPFTVYWQGEVGADTGIFQTLTRFLVDTPVPVTGNTLTITPDMLGVNLRAVVQYVDGDNVIERVVSIPQTVLAPDGTGGTLIVPDPAVAIGPDLAGTVVDGVTLVAGDQGILEDLGAFGTTPAGTPLTFTVDSLLVNIRAANPGATIDMVRGLSGNPILTPRVADGDPLPGTLTFDNLTQIFTFVPAQDFNGGITFEFEVTTPAGVPAGAEATLEVFGVNDAPVAGTNTGNLAAVDAGTTFTFTEAQLIGNATDVDGDNLELVRSADPLLVGADQFVLLADEAQGTIVLNADGSFTFTAAAGAFGPVVLEYSITDRIATVATTATFTMGRTFNGVGNENDAVTGTIAGDILNGNGGADVLNGGDGNDQLTGGAGGPDRLNGQGGDDTIVYDVGDGTGAARDIVDGGLGGTDTYVVNGSNTDDDFTVYAAAAWVALGGGRALQSAASDIVITRNGTGNGNVIAELDEIEEIVINTGAGTDTVDIVGDFSPTNLAFNTIHVNNEEGEDIVDVTGIESDHRTVLAGDGTITGKRDQDQQVAYAGETTDDNDVDFDDDATDATGDDDDETFTGNDDANEIHGGGGEDDIYGGHGNDKLEGGSGSDNVDGGSGNDSFVATIGDGNDQYSGGAGADTYDASATTKGVVVELGKDRAVGSEIGTDIIRSVENVIGGSGDDALVGDDANNKIWGNAGNDVIGGRAGNDLLFGGADNDYINGSRGNDQLFGDSGADTLRGGMGNDRMTGGVGNDSFRFNAGFGNDVITDFDANASGGQDKLDLRDMGIRSSDFANRVDIIDQGSDVLIRVDDSNTIRLKDVANVNSVTINDFVLFGG